MNTIEKNFKAGAIFLAASVALPMLLTFSSPSEALQAFGDTPDTIGIAQIGFYLLFVILGLAAIAKITKLSAGWKRLVLVLASAAALGIVLLAYEDIVRYDWPSIADLYLLEWLGAFAAALVLVPSAIIAWIYEGFAAQSEGTV